MKESMLKPIRIDAGLGNPPKEYTNNDPESANFMVKHALHFDPQKPHEFIDEMRKIVETQYRNKDRAVCGKGQYEVRPELQHLEVEQVKQRRKVVESRGVREKWHGAQERSLQEETQRITPRDHRHRTSQSPLRVLVSQPFLRQSLLRCLKRQIILWKRKTT